MWPVPKFFQLGVNRIEVMMFKGMYQQLKELNPSLKRQGWKTLTKGRKKCTYGQLQNSASSNLMANAVRSQMAYIGILMT